MIHNRNETRFEFSNQDILPVMETLVAQLRILLGIPNSISSDEISFLASPTGLSDREIDNLIRYHLFFNIDSSLSTLLSLSSLITTLDNMPVRAHIGELSKLAIDSIAKVLFFFFSFFF